MPKQKIIRGILDKNLDTIGGLSDFLGLLIYSDNAPLPGAGVGVGAQARYPCAPFRLPSASVRHTISMKNAPANLAGARLIL